MAVRGAGYGVTLLGAGHQTCGWRCGYICLWWALWLGHRGRIPFDRLLEVLLRMQQSFPTLCQSLLRGMDCSPPAMGAALKETKRGRAALEEGTWNPAPYRPGPPQPPPWPATLLPPQRGALTAGSQLALVRGAPVPPPSLPNDVNILLAVPGSLNSHVGPNTW